MSTAGLGKRMSEGEEHEALSGMTAARTVLEWELHAVVNSHAANNL